MSPTLAVYLVLGLPLAGFLTLALLKSFIPKPWGGWIASLGILGSFFLTCFLLIQQTSFSIPLINWFHTGFISGSLSFWIDPLSLWMSLMITGVGTLIHVYSIGYMKEDSRYNSFFSYLNLFVFFMLILVLADSYIGMFAGWEGVGLCSYLLIGFWYENQSYNNAAKKAFIINRIGDLGFLMGILLLLSHLGTTQFGSVFAQIPFMSPEIITAITLFLLIGAIGKSAQLPLYTWLPDAMAGPTPVSALIHAATMVTAGIYMIARSNILFTLSPVTSTIIVIIGLGTALVGAIIALAQRDIKKILAYSTMSQLGFMMATLGFGAYTTALFHMTTHAFFKALLFLAAGNVIHSLNGEQDIFKMGGLKKALPFTFIVFLVGTLAIVGCPPFAGFFSKDAILFAAAGHSWLSFGVLALVSVLTAFYMFRLLFLTFFGTSRHPHHAHEAPWVMQVPLGILALLSTVGGLLNLPSHPRMTHFLSNVCPNLDFQVPEQLEHIVLVSTLVILATLAAITYHYYGKKIWSSAKPNMTILHKVVYNKFYIDELYEMVLVAPYRTVSQFLSHSADAALNACNTLLGKALQTSTYTLKYTQNGNIGLYILMMVVGIILLLFQWVSL